ncbi:hypothetical protein QO034_01725 [Sedimentitalea sp. JM2-8]|uniref:Transposase n=1 Tax=Sedimentitalea xiamensis TaxID=3050037 RepID=A0ABT7FAE5_9RHOB|nr:hypothetical protein [Sedimentitalea xiamensis]MDK3071819.1 hypothetical protein [Sedimentitalea xiamensis]
MREIVERLADLNVEMSTSGVARLLDRHGGSRKMTLLAAEQARDDVAETRSAWLTDVTELDASKLVFIDESGFDTRMSRGSARAGLKPSPGWFPFRPSPPSKWSSRRSSESSKRCRRMS